LYLKKNVDRISNVTAGEPEAPRKRLTRSEAKARTRQRLLDAAALVFAQKGFGGASLEEIAESAGYSTGALYANFENKEQLFMELVAARRSTAASQRSDVISEVFAQQASEGVDPFDALSKLFVQVADRDRDFAPLQAEFWLFAVRNPAAMEVIAAGIAEQVEVLEPVVAGFLDRVDGTPDATAREVTTVLLALFQGLVRRRRLDAAAVPDDLIARAVRWLLVGMRGAPPAGTPEVVLDRAGGQKRSSPRSKDAR
jgi:AcrR family transcriptional regulator